MPRPGGADAGVSDGIVGGRRVVLEAVRAGRASEVLIAREAHSTQSLRELADVCRDAGVERRLVARAELDRITRDHQGVAARISVPEPIGERQLSAWPFGDDDVVVALDGIVDPHNLGAAARSAESAGAVMLVTRSRRAADVTPAAIRASAGALLHLPRARVANIPRALARLQEAGFTVVGLDESAERTVYDEPCPAGRIAIALGAEGTGLARLSREACDILVRLPMRGRVGSMNASASLAAALYAYVLPSRTDDGA